MFMSPSISILISTSNERILNIPLDFKNEMQFVVVHQLYSGGGNLAPFDRFSGCTNVQYERLNYPGLSKSRNRALDLCLTKYAYIMDDDVEVDVDRIRELVEYMEAEKTDVATCQYICSDGSFPKKYPENIYLHDFLSSARVSSIEMCVNIEAVRKQNIKFDERFGLGADYPSGEEYIFLTDCLKKGLVVKYYPITTGVHPVETSGADFFTEPNKVLAKREMFKRVFRWKSLLYIPAFWIKKLPVVIRRGYGFSFTKTLLMGIK